MGDMSMSDTPSRVSPSEPGNDAVTWENSGLSIGDSAPSTTEDFEKAHTCAGTECGWYKTTVNLRAELASLRSQLSRIQQTGLTAEEAAVFAEREDAELADREPAGWAWACHPRYESGLAKLRSLAALRSLEGEGK